MARSGGARRGRPVIRGRVEVHADSAALAEAVARGFAQRAAEAVARGGRFVAALTGGSSPVAAFRRLASREISRLVPWEGVHLCWGDERCVPPRHPRSNFGSAERLLLRHVPIPPENVHRIRGELGAARGAEAYQAELHELFSGWPPRFDLVHLGVGPDGHVASLFPFDLSRLLEREPRVLPAQKLPEGEPRVTLSFAVLNAAARIEVLLPEAAKSRIAARALHGPLDPLRLPVQRLDPTDGELVWMLTRAVELSVEPADSAS